MKRFIIPLIMLTVILMLACVVTPITATVSKTAPNQHIRFYDVTLPVPTATPHVTGDKPREWMP